MDSPDRTAGNRSMDASDRRAGWLAVLAGAALAFVVQVAAPVGVPLYDGVVVEEPYRFLQPGAGQVGSPTSFTSAPGITDGRSPNFVAATTESPPQAQLLGLPGAFTVPPGATTMAVSITAVEPPVVAPPGVILGNVYRFSVADGAGVPLARNAACTPCVTLVLRAPAGSEAGQIWMFRDGSWTALETNHAGMVSMYSAEATTLGDFAVVSVSGDGEGLGPNAVIILGGALVILALSAVAFLAFGRNRPPRPPRVRPSGATLGPGSGSGPRSRAIPSKRKRPPRPPSGRSEP